MLCYQLNGKVQCILSYSADEHMLCESLTCNEMGPSNGISFSHFGAEVHLQHSSSVGDALAVLSGMLKSVVCHCSPT